jgi:hypothetical protein
LTFRNFTCRRSVIGGRSAIGAPTIELIQSEYDRGRMDAQKDAAQRARKIFVQTRGAWGRFLCDLMRDRYDIFVEHASDMTTAARLSYERGYNSVNFEYIDERHGAGTTERIWAEVDAFRAEHYSKYFSENPPPSESSA